MEKDICWADVLFYGRGKAWGFVGGEHRPAGQWPKAKTLPQAEFISAEDVKSTRWNPKKKDIRSDVLLLEQVKESNPPIKLGKLAFYR